MAAWPSLLRADAIERDGMPRYTPDSRYPIGGQCVAQAFLTLSRSTRLEPGLAERRWAVFGFALRRLAQRMDEAIVFQRERYWVNRIAHPRWVQAPMLAALSNLVPGIT